MIRAALLVWAGCVLAGCPGCSPSFYTEVRYRSGVESPGVPAPGTSKASVLASHGPPLEVLPLPNGDLFVYRVRRVDQRIWNVDTRQLSPLAVPLYVDALGERRDDSLMVFFDRQGKVTVAAVQRSGSGRASAP